MSEETKPVIGFPTSQMNTGGRRSSHTVGQGYIKTIAEVCRATPVMLPSIEGGIPVRDYLGLIDGLLLTGGRANIEPHHFDGDPFPDDEPTDPQRDAAVMPLIRACIDEGVPVFGTCRGIQELNVALGGSLHYRLHLLPGKLDHRMRRDENGEPYGAQDMRHSITIAEGGVFRCIVAQQELMVNSLHGQGIDKLGTGLAVEAVSEDGVIEGVRVEGSKAPAIGVQWHAEFEPEKHALSKGLLEAFADAARVRRRRR